jgi:hypothetical protein
MVYHWIIRQLLLNTGETMEIEENFLAFKKLSENFLAYRFG